MEEKVKVWTTASSEGNTFCSKGLKHFRPSYLLSKGYKENAKNSGTTPLNLVHMNGGGAGRGGEKRILPLKRPGLKTTSSGVFIA